MNLRLLSRLLLGVVVLSLLYIISTALYDPNVSLNKAATRDLDLPSDHVGKGVLNVIVDARFAKWSVYQAAQHLLFGNIQRPIHYIFPPGLRNVSREHWPVYSDALLLVMEEEIMGINMKDYITFLREKGAKNIGLVHDGDYVCHLSSFYDQVDYIIRRRYYCNDPNMRPKRGIWFPHGWADGAGPRNPSSLMVASKRPVSCFFKGKPISHRTLFVDAMNATKAECEIESTPYFGAGDPRYVYAERLATTKFAPCPRGSQIETIRFYDALENGAIPIVLYDDKLIKYIMEYEGVSSPKALPFLVLDDWMQYNDAVHPYLEDNVKLDKLQERAMKFWDRVKKRTQNSVRALVDQSFARNSDKY